VPCGRSDAALASGLRRWEAEERALEGVPLAVSSREDLVAVLAKPPEALALTRRGITLVSPKVGVLFFVAGFCAAEARHPDEAERNLRRAVATDPTNIDFRGELSFALIQLKRLDEAEREVDAGLSLASNDCNRGFFWRKRGYILIDRGDLADAYRAYAESLKFDPSSDIPRKEMDLIVSQIRQKGGYDSKTLNKYEPPPPSDEMRVKQCPKK
jgi:tetratricopeptide (TPR) repeat protein